MNDIVSRAEAVARGLKHFFSGRPCKNGSIAQRHVTGSRCICEPCRAERSARVMQFREKSPEYAAAQLESAKRHYQKHREKILEGAKDYHQRNKETRNAACKKYYNDNKPTFRLKRQEYYLANKSELIEYGRKWAREHAESHRASVKKWTDANRERVREIGREWARNNPVKMRAKWSRRRASEIRATPAWLTEDHRLQIEQVYREAARLELSTGVPHHVDHIIPLRGVTVCGLHVPWNLQAIPANDNLRKSNKIIA